MVLIASVPDLCILFTFGKTVPKDFNIKPSQISRPPKIRFRDYNYAISKVVCMCGILRKLFVSAFCVIAKTLQ